MPWTASISRPVSVRLARGLLLLALFAAVAGHGQSVETVDFENAEITGRWVDTWEEKGVVFTPAHAPTKSKAKARLMFFHHLGTGRKGILSAMANDPVPVRARLPRASTSVTVTFWGSTGCPVRLRAFDTEGNQLDQVELASVPDRKAPGDPVPTVELTVKATNIVSTEFSGPRPGEHLVADELRFTPN